MISDMVTRFVRSILIAVIVLALLAAEDNLKYGKPACAGPVLDKKYFVICYDAEHKDPTWVGYALTKDDAATKATGRAGSFRPDAALDKGERAENADYANSGYDKGHMAPANDFKRSLAAMKATFVLSNAVPQRHGVNGGKWAQLEGAVHDFAAEQGTVWVVSGPLYVANKAVKTIGANKVAVPTHTFKVVLYVDGNGDKQMFGFVLPNVNKPAGTMSSYALSVAKVEKLTGLEFFGELPAAEQKKLKTAATALPGM